MARAKGVSPRSRSVIWARAAGRCMFPGCNSDLTGDLIAGQEDRNFGFIAHIVADIPGGPRGDPVRSPALCDAPANLMLMCAVHHKTIDVDAVDDFPEPRLLAIKAEHERRIAVAADIQSDRASHVLRYAANIGHHESLVAYEHISAAMLPTRYPAQGRHTLDLEMLGCALEDHEPAYWDFHRENLRRQYTARVQERIQAREIRHLSVFALAPQPLLIELGRLLGDITPADIRQLHREPKGWAWADDSPPLTLTEQCPTARTGPIALVLALSATVSDERVRAVLGRDAAIWRIAAECPHNDIMRRRDDLVSYARTLRRIFDAIKAVHGESQQVHLFPALPISAAIETGRAWMPKADLPLVVYDQNRRTGGFEKALTVGAGQ